MEIKSIIKIEKCSGHPDWSDVLEIIDHKTHFALTMYRVEEKKGKRKTFRFGDGWMELKKEDMQKLINTFSDIINK